MAGQPDDPRSTAEKARADLKRNDEMGMAVPESPIEERPSATPATFGEHRGPGLETGPPGPRDPDGPSDTE